jgi:hypothetical protein
VAAPDFAALLGRSVAAGASRHITLPAEAGPLDPN